MLEIYGGRARAILIAATTVAAIWDAGDFFMRDHALVRQAPCALIQLRHGHQGYTTGVCFVSSNAKRKEKKELLGTSSNESNVREKIYSLYEDLKTQPRKGFGYFRMSSATFEKLLVLLVQVLCSKIPEWESPFHQETS
jgi:hypothetical protein